MKSWKWYVYIIECADHTFYTGLTWNIAIRGDQHASGFGGKYTQKHGFKRIAYVEECNDLEAAREREKQIKSWNQRKKLKLISGEWKNEW